MYTFEVFHMKVPLGCHLRDSCVRISYETIELYSQASVAVILLTVILPGRPEVATGLPFSWHLFYTPDIEVFKSVTLFCTSLRLIYTNYRPRSKGDNTAITLLRSSVLDHHKRSVNKVV